MAAVTHRPQKPWPFKPCIGYTACRNTLSLQHIPRPDSHLHTSYPSGVRHSLGTCAPHTGTPSQTHRTRRHTDPHKRCEHPDPTHTHRCVNPHGQPTCTRMPLRTPSDSHMHRPSSYSVEPALNPTNNCVTGTTRLPGRYTPAPALNLHVTFTKQMPGPSIKAAWHLRQGCQLAWGRAWRAARLPGGETDTQ